MSTFVHAKKNERIKDISQLRGYFHQFAKSHDQRLVGLECEVLAVRPDTGKAVSYGGKQGIEAILNRYATCFKFHRHHENGRIIALQKGRTLISLEPGGQIELSAEPVKSVHEIQGQITSFFTQLKTVAEEIGNVRFIAYGIHPFSQVKQIQWVPKTRYKIMAKYLGRQGALAHHMMKRTAGNQVNFDYLNEDDAFEKMCLVMRLTSIVTALFSNSSFSNGKVNRYASERLWIWQHTDPERCGLLLKGFCFRSSFESYLNYLLNLRMMFIIRKRKWIPMQHLTFKRFIQERPKNIKATLDDFELHVSTVFPEARFRQYLEIRGADGQSAHLVPSVAAFWKGILYDAGASCEARKIVQQWTEEEHLNLYHDVARNGMNAKIRKLKVREIARELVCIAMHGLKSNPIFNTREEDERVFLEPVLHEILNTGETQAERLARLWKGSFSRSPQKLVDYLSI